MKKSFFLLLLFTGYSFYAKTQPLQPLTPEREVWTPEPAIVTPGNVPGEKPSDAIVLFDGKSLDEWVSVRDSALPATWVVANGMMTVNKAAGTIRTKRKFMDYQLHLEWLIPSNVSGQGQARGNSGVFMASFGAGDNGYELQVLDSYQSKTYVNGQAGAVYNQYAPMVNACKKPGEWQTYDIIWIAPRFNEDSTIKSPARVTAFQNGILIQYDVPLRGPTSYWPGSAVRRAHGASPIKLQCHGDPGEPTSYRNIWIRNL